MKNKKSQMEIIGLAIVVVLLLVATIFIVRFLVLKTPLEYRKGFVSSELASNIVNTFLKVNADGCKHFTMSELLKDCAQGEYVPDDISRSGDICCSCTDEDTSDTKDCSCDDNDVIPTDDVRSCKFVHDAANSIFEKTLKERNSQYEFLTYTSTKPQLIKVGTACEAEKTSSKPWAIPTTDGGVVYVKLDICG